MELRNGESVIQQIRQHWIVVAGTTGGSFGILAAVLASALYLPFDFFGYASALYSVVALGTVAWLLFRLYIWRQNQLLITNLRIINNEQKGLFNRTVTELLYKDISDVSFTQDGVAASTYDYGTLVIRLPSQDQVSVEAIPHPARVIERINGIRMGSPGSSGPAQ